MPVVVWRKLLIEYGFYIAENIFIMLARIQETQPLSGMPHFALSLFPMVIPLGLIGEKPIMNRLILYPTVFPNLYLRAQFWMRVRVA